MTILRIPSWILRFAVAAFWVPIFTLANSPALATTELIPVDYSIEVAHGDWVPIEPEEMERASIDAALARLSDEGRLRVGDRVDSAAESDPAIGHLGFSVRLIGRAETLQLTIRLDLPGEPTAVATTAVSVARLDYRGIYEAFEHAGRTSAERLAPKLPRVLGSAVEAVEGKDVSLERKALFARAQKAKRSRRFDDARRLFGELADSPADGGDVYDELSQDELRYGLPAFEAQQLMNDVASVMGSPGGGTRRALMSRAEHLYRQIEAENHDRGERVAEAQRAIDQLLISRRALANATRANTLSKAMGVRMYLTEAVMMHGECPDASATEDILGQSRGGFVLGAVSDKSAGSRTYTLEDPTSGSTVDLECDLNGVRFVGGPGSAARPAAADSSF